MSRSPFTEKCNPKSKEELDLKPTKDNRISIIYYSAQKQASGRIFSKCIFIKHTLRRRRVHM